MASESVLVVARAALFGGAWPQGFQPCSGVAGAALMATLASAGRFILRPIAERSPQWKQPIPYCLVRRGDELLSVERLPAQGEARLHGMRSIGLGGHIGPEDAGHPEGAIRGALTRELAEELDLGPAASRRPQFLGILNDDRNAVGRVHFGLVFRLDLAPGETAVVRENLKMQGGFGRLAGPGGLWQDLGRFETWSRILLEALAPGGLASDPTPVAIQGPQDHIRQE